jgi:hypothetical protein
MRNGGGEEALARILGPSCSWTPIARREARANGNSG